MVIALALLVYLRCRTGRKLILHCSVGLHIPSVSQGWLIVEDETLTLTAAGLGGGTVTI